jgi:hypothetical protein
VWGARLGGSAVGSVVGGAGWVLLGLFVCIGWCPLGAVRRWGHLPIVMWGLLSWLGVVSGGRAGGGW